MRDRTGHRILLLAGLLAPAPAIAQTAPPVQLPAVSVTGERETATSPVEGYVANRAAAGTKTDTPILETPQSISVIPRDQMTDLAVQGLNEALRYTSGVAPETRGAVATRYDQLTIRGFDADYYWNGLKLQPLYYTMPQIDPFLLERVEVLKGPSSVLYGQAPAGGIINQISKRPLATPQGEAGIEFGTQAHLRGMLDATGPLDAEGKYLYRFTATGLTEDGQIDRTENERVAVAPSFTWRPDADTTLTLLGFYQHDPRGASYGAIPAQGTVLPNPLGRIPVDFYDGDPNFETFDRRQTALGYEFQRQLGSGWVARLNGRWMRVRTEYDSVYGNGLGPDNRTLARGLATSREALSTLNLDNQLEGRFTTGPLGHTLLAGFDYQRMDGYYAAGFGVGPSLDVFAPVYRLPITAPPRFRTDVRGNQYGTYVQDQLRLGGFVLTLAGRGDWVDSRTKTAFGESESFDRAFTGRAGLTYVFDNGLAPYISYAESFTPQTGTDFAGNPFDPEEGRLYEVGVKYQPTWFSGLFTAALFDLTRSNLLTADPLHPGLSVQSGEARSRGLELEARVNITDHVGAVASYTYLDAEYTKDNGGLEGKRLAAVPRHQASLWATYELPETSALKGLSVGAGVRYKGSTDNTTNTFKVPAVTLFDASLSYELEALSPALKGAELAVVGKNLFDKEYVASCYWGDWCAYGYQRTVVGSLRYRW